MSATGILGWCISSSLLLFSFVHAPPNNGIARAIHMWRIGGQDGQQDCWHHSRRIGVQRGWSSVYLTKANGAMVTIQPSTVYSSRPRWCCQYSTRCTYWTIAWYLLKDPWWYDNDIQLTALSKLVSTILHSVMHYTCKRTISTKTYSADEAQHIVTRGTAMCSLDLMYSCEDFFSKAQHHDYSQFIPLCTISTKWRRERVTFEETVLWQTNHFDVSTLQKVSTSTVLPLCMYSINQHMDSL